MAVYFSKLEENSNIFKFRDEFYLHLNYKLSIRENERHCQWSFSMDGSVVASL